MQPYWETKTLAEMSPSEWEGLCDGCGLCCVIRFEDEDTGDVVPTRVHCKLFDSQACSCSDYANRNAQVPDCMAQVARQLSVEDVSAVSAWLASQPVPAQGRPATALAMRLPLPCGGVPQQPQAAAGGVR